MLRVELCINLEEFLVGEVKREDLGFLFFIESFFIC